jgi:ribonuclease HII
MFYINFINSFQKIYDIEDEVIDNSDLLLEKIRRLEIELIDSKFLTSEDKSELLKEFKDENSYAKDERKSRHEKSNATRQWLEIMKKDMDD